MNGANDGRIKRRIPRIVIVGGGAGGLELATRLGSRFVGRANHRRKSARAEIVLIERDRTHFWKPHLHEIAAGSMDLDMHETDYLAQAHWNGFQYLLGTMEGLDCESREVIVASSLDEDGNQLTPQRRVPYDWLVIAVGSQVNDFGTPGVNEHAIALDTPLQASLFHRRLLNALIRANAQTESIQPGQLHVGIIGAGATGVELAAQLRQSSHQMISFGLNRIDPQNDIGIHLMEAAPRILPALPARLSASAEELLRGLGIDVHTNARVSEVQRDAVLLSNGERIASSITVWAAGVKAPEFLADIGGLQTNRANQLVVRQTLQSTRDDAVFAIGDCCSVPWLGREGNVPPRAQAAHQQASFLVRQFDRLLAGQPLREWKYRDFGSLVSLGSYSTVGSLMGGLVGGSLWVEGLFARLMYLALYKQHQVALQGWLKTILDTLARLLTRRNLPRVKLH